MPGNLSWLDAVLMALSRYSTPSSRFGVKLEDPTRLSTHRKEILTGQLTDVCISPFWRSSERDVC